MKKILLTSLMAIGLTTGAYADTNNDSSLNVYGVGQKSDDKTYNGAGAKYENDFSEVVIEGGSNFKKVSAVLKYDINQDIYIKGGVAYLKKEISINSKDTDVSQKTGGFALGYGNNDTYNLEAGLIRSSLSGASNADTNSYTSYIEGLIVYGDVDTVGVYKNTKVYSNNYSDYSLDLGYYPIEDIRLSAKYDSTDKDENDYAVNVGIKYTFEAKQPWSPYLTASKNFSSNVSASFEYSKNIQNKSLNMRDEFENSVNTSGIVAQDVAPDVFVAKNEVVKKATESTSDSSSISTPTITMADTFVNDGGGGDRPPFSPTVTNVASGAVYSIVSDPTSGMLTINSSTGAMTWNGNLFSDTPFNITIKVVNPDGGTQSTTFTLTVVNNG